MTTYEKSEYLEQIAQKVISENECFAHLEGCRIAYQQTDAHKTNSGKTVFADCEKIRDKFKAFIPYDFIITYYEDARDLSEETQEKLMFHELCHVGYEPENDRLYIVPHDIEDFRVVIEKFGADWAVDWEK